MGGDEAFHVTAAIGVRLRRLARQHQFDDVQDVPGNLYVSHIASVMKRHKKFVFEPASIPANWNNDLRSSRGFNSTNVVFIRQTRHDTS